MFNLYVFPAHLVANIQNLFIKNKKFVYKKQTKVKNYLF